MDERNQTTPVPGQVNGPYPVDGAAASSAVPAPGGYSAPAAVPAPVQTPAAAVPPPAPAQRVTDGDRPDADDDIWIERTKKAIAETQNDPYRQVQLLQHLNKLYLKERFGREVQADKA